MGSSGDWKNGTEGLGDQFHSIAVDLPGHGCSLGLPEEEYTMDGAANALLRTLDDLGVRRASIAGYSMGGRLALYFALRHPERCEKLFLESASPGLKSEEERAARQKADKDKAKRLESSADFDAFLEAWYQQPLFATLGNGGLVESLIEKRRKNDPIELAKSLRGMGTGSQPSLWEELTDLRVPTLAVVGELDGKFAGIAWEMAKRSPHISVEVIPSAGHNVRLEAPEAYLSSVRRFTSRAGGG